VEQNKTESNPSPSPFAQTYFHGTKADLKIGALLKAGFNSNYTQYGRLNHIYFTATLDAAIWGAELASGAGTERIYLVEPTGSLLMYILSKFFKRKRTSTIDSFQLI